MSLPRCVTPFVDEPSADMAMGEMGRRYTRWVLTHGSLNFWDFSHTECEILSSCELKIDIWSAISASLNTSDVTLGYFLCLYSFWLCFLWYFYCMAFMCFYVRLIFNISLRWLWKDIIDVELSMTMGCGSNVWPTAISDGQPVPEMMWLF